MKKTLAMLILLISILPVNAADDFCRVEIKPASENELSYRQRGDRCEGLFAQKVSATGLRIAAFHKHPASYDENSLAINISSGDSRAIKALTVTSLRPKQFYRMDTVYHGSNYSLSLDVVRHPDVNVKPTDFAAVICKENCDAATPTLIPASFVDENPFNPYVALVANLELYELRISIKDGDTGGVLFDKEMLGSRTWPAARPATFPLKPYLSERKNILFEVVASGRGNKLIDSISARLEGQ
ncbi:hypothetical protein [Pseudovibrio brasiliensis]|uniref:Gliding motility-associated protein GldM C-terminal domain-containing protein n=1 Tax=Pseudovibrio brasiliensis TaxID=1898042 RepID=A0ABX8AZ91_9HYPH|nr:hypothetical protein [Pseudovibrio brasiliensis]QUS59155.1 hypothetical protein KGB56_26540 [Pseudovibrio brasiliensis]